MILRAHPDKPVPQDIFSHPRFTDAMDALEALPTKFYLTGSWAFGTQGRKSDLDLYTADLDSVAVWLQENGYDELDHNPEYSGDPLLKRLFQSGWIHIQLVNPISVKHKIQGSFENLPEEIQSWAFGKHNILKPHRRYIWQIASHLMGLDIGDKTPAVTSNSNPHVCKICGSPGIDMAVTFYCTNPQCRNYKP